MSLNDRLDKIEKTKKVRSLIIKALGAFKRGNIEESALFYEEAADISESLGHDDLAKQYKEKAKSMRTKGEVIEKKLDEKEKESIDMLQEADKFIKTGEFGKAAKIFEEAADLAPSDRAVEYKREANELFKKEKEMDIIRQSLKMKEDSKAKYLELLEQIKTSVKNKDVGAAIKYIEKAIVLAKELDKDDEVEQLRNQAHELKKKQIDDIEKEKESGEKKSYSERGEIVEDYTQILTDLKEALSDNNYKLAFELYIKAGDLALKMGEPGRADLFRKKAEELKDEVIKQEQIEKLNSRVKELQDKIDKLDEKRNTDELILYYTELIGALAELGKTNDIETYDKKIETLKQFKKRSELETDAKKAADEKNYEKALLLFRQAAKISVDLGDNISYSDQIDKIKDKAEKVSTQRSLIDRRSIAIANAKKYLDENDYDKAVKEYQEAASISNELGDVEIAQSYRETAERLDKDREIIQEKNKFLKEAEQAIKEKNYELASDYFQQVAKFCEKISELDEAEKYRKKAKIILELSEID
jgi:hypothetical protein